MGEIFVKIRVRQEDTDDAISCTGSGYCSEFGPESIEYDEEKRMCRIVNGAYVAIDGVMFSEGDLPPEQVEHAAEVVIGCDSDALLLVDIDGKAYGSNDEAVRRRAS